jgi:hypothetical protein
MSDEGDVIQVEMLDELSEVLGEPAGTTRTIGGPLRRACC